MAYLVIAECLATLNQFENVDMVGIYTLIFIKVYFTLKNVKVNSIIVHACFKNSLFLVLMVFNREVSSFLHFNRMLFFISLSFSHYPLWEFNPLFSYHGFYPIL